MAIAVFSDIHGNAEALEAIIKHARKKNKIKDLYFLGDAITFGPDSGGCIKTLKAAGVHCVVGNHEQRVIRYDNAVKTKTYATPAHMNFIFNQLDREDLGFIKSWPTNIKINYKGVNIYFTHYAHDANGIIQDEYEEFTESKLNKLFGGAKADIVFFGHLHNRKIIVDEHGKSFVCAGPSGCTKADKTFYTYFDVKRDGDDVNFEIFRVTVPFNRKKFCDKFISTPLPDKEKYAEFTFGIKLPGTESNEKK